MTNDIARCRQFFDRPPAARPAKSLAADFRVCQRLSKKDHGSLKKLARQSIQSEAIGAFGKLSAP